MPPRPRPAVEFEDEAGAPAKEEEEEEEESCGATKLSIGAALSAFCSVNVIPPAIVTLKSDPKAVCVFSALV
jgi:hypothetical protein